jgi:hypothetical protein
MSVKFPVRSEIQEKVRHIPVNPRRYCGHIISGDSFRFTDKSKYRYRMAIMMIVSGSSMHVPIWHGWPPDRNFQFGLLGWRQKWTMAEQQFDPRSISWDSFYGIFSFSCPGLNSPLGAWKLKDDGKEGGTETVRSNEPQVQWQVMRIFAMKPNQVNPHLPSTSPYLLVGRRHIK